MLQGELHVEPDVGKQPVFREMVLRCTVIILITVHRTIFFTIITHGKVVATTNHESPWKRHHPHLQLREFLL